MGEAHLKGRLQTLQPFFVIALHRRSQFGGIIAPVSTPKDKTLERMNNKRFKNLYMAGAGSSLLITQPDQSMAWLNLHLVSANATAVLSRIAPPP